MIQKVIIASVLKPVDDVRHYEKLASSLAIANKYEIIILGKGTDKKSPTSNIVFRPTGNFRRFSWKRLKAQWLLAQTIINERPALVLITAPELLLITSLMKMFFGFRLVYDVQEDYERNLSYQNEYNGFEKWLFRLLFRFHQAFISKVDHFLLAERCFTDHLNFIGERYTVLENKLMPQWRSPKNIHRWQYGQELKLIFSGSISIYAGIERVIQFFEKIQSFYPNSTLTVIGTFHHSEIKNRLDTRAKTNPRIHLFIQDQPVAHHQIIEVITHHHAGIIGYLPDQVSGVRIPTKMYEYAGLGLPYFFESHTYWNQRAAELGGGISVNMENVKVNTLLNQLVNLPAWDQRPALWEKESILIQDVMNTLIK